MGENSPQFQTFKTTLGSFQLNKTPRGINQTNILQSVFKFCSSVECFQKFRLVSKSWQNAVETIRLDRSPSSTLISELCQLVEINESASAFFKKYLGIFRKVVLNFVRDFDSPNMDLATHLVLTHMRKLNFVIITKSERPENFESFLFQFIQKSKSTLENLALYYVDEMISLPNVCLPNLNTLSMITTYLQDDKTEELHALIKQFPIICENLKSFMISDILQAPPILNFLIENYSKHFIYAPEILVLDKIPLQISHLNLQNLGVIRYSSQIQYLFLDVPNLMIPSEGGWDEYKQILTYFPNLKAIAFYLYDDREITNIEMLIHSIPVNKRRKWEERISFFKSKNLQILNEEQVLEIIATIRENVSTSWSFDFLCLQK
jgi:hypothetical protein